MIDLITGYKGEAHITAAEVGKFNANLVGTGNYVFSTGSKFEYQLISNNCVRIKDGDAMFQGREFYVEEYEDVVIDTGTADQYRNDLIVARYEKNTSTGVESISLVAIRGTESDTAATDPAYTQGSIIAGDNVVDVPLYRVKLTGLNITAIEKIDGWTEVTPITSLSFANAVTYTAAIGTSWTADGDIFKQTITVTGMKSTDNPIMDLITTTTGFEAEQEAYGKIFKLVSGFNEITVYASEETETALNIQLKVVR